MKETTTLPFVDQRTHYTIIYDRLYNAAFYFARRFVPVEDAEDITMEVFQALFRLNKRFDYTQEAKVWLQVSVRNACLNLIKSRKSKEKNKKMYAYIASAEIDNSSEGWLIEDAWGKFLYKRLHEEIEKLPPKMRKVFTMTYIEQMNAKQISEILGISEHTVFNHRKQGMKKMRAALKGYDLTVMLLALAALNGIE
jgi:RNA polymerase sigma-70 factor (ECF subfamily)